MMLRRVMFVGSCFAALAAGMALAEEPDAGPQADRGLSATPAGAESKVLNQDLDDLRRTMRQLRSQQETDGAPDRPRAPGAPVVATPAGEETPARRVELGRPKASPTVEPVGDATGDPEASQDARQQVPTRQEMAPAAGQQNRGTRQTTKLQVPSASPQPLKGKLEPAAAANALPIPEVPASVVSEARAEAAAEVPAAMENVITVRSGETQLIAVATGHLNRIVTPFSEPEVVTTSDAKYRISGNVVYVAATQSSTLFVTRKGDESVAIGLGLVPKRIPPREITLKLEGQDPLSMVAGRSTKAERWERNQPFVETVRGVMRDMALGQVPPGYAMRTLSRSDTIPRCAGPAGMSFSFTDGQVVSGNSLEVLVGVVSSQAPEPVELQESWCATPDVVAVAYWPFNLIGSGEATEVYVVRRPGLHVPAASLRPSLLHNTAGSR